MRRSVLAAGFVAVVSLAVGTGAGAGAEATEPGDSYVAEWDAIGSAAFTDAALSPAEGHIIFTYVSVAVYDAVMAVTREYRPFLVDVEAPEGADPEAAVATAAHVVLAEHLPAQRGTILDPAYSASLDSIPDGEAKTDGVDVGAQVAEALISMRREDGFRAAASYSPPDPLVPGVWLPTAPVPAIGAYLGQMRPFALKSAEQFRPQGPPALKSRRWARDYTEAKQVGAATSTTRTAAQAVSARFWAEAPVQQARASFRLFLAEHDLDVVEAARFMAMVSVVYGDAFIACFDAKYHFAFWRPTTAIRAGETDGNTRTAADAGWAPLLAGVPNHPEYPSAHACITPAAGIVAAKFLRTAQIDFTVPSLTGLGDRSYEKAKDLTDDVGDARVWGGIHFRSAVDDGTWIAHRTANYVLARHFTVLEQ